MWLIVILWLHHLDPVAFFSSDHLTEFHSALKVLKNEGAKHASYPKQLFDTLQQPLKGDRGRLTEVCRASWTFSDKQKGKFEWIITISYSWFDEIISCPKKGSLFFFSIQEGSNTADSVRDGLPFLLNGFIDSNRYVQQLIQ